MNNIILSFCLLFLSTFSVFACEVNINIKQIHALQIDTKELNLVATSQLADKGYRSTTAQGKYLAKIVISKGRDIHAINNFFAKASVSLYKSGQMQNYTHGQGKTYDVILPAYTLEMYKLAIENAIYHLPECLN